MKKLLVILALTMLSLSAYAAEKGEMYLGPVLGYHFFDNDHELDDNAEIGLRYGYFFMSDHALELEADYTNTDYDKGGDKDATSLSLTAVKFFDFNDYYKPFIFLGAGGLFHEDSMASLVGGIGARFIANEKISVDLRLKDMLHSKDGRNDVIPSIALNYHFGSTYAPVKYEEEKPAEKMMEPQKDTDGDGIFDEDDQCPDTPTGYPVNNAGCVVDSDGDGVYDFMDKCWTEKGLPVDKTGCTPDSDNDGVYDFEDRCPNSMEGVKVNSAGCFVSATLKINFKTNSAMIDESYLDDIQKFAVFLKMNPHVNVEIQGHTDNKGAAEYNMQLSQRRAESVMKALIDKYSISKNRLSAMGYGENMPLVPNDTPENMMKNRRIDTVVK